jgi:hypothetical protein
VNFSQLFKTVKVHRFKSPSFSVDNAVELSRSRSRGQPD